VKFHDKKKWIPLHTEYLAAALSVIHNVPCFMEKLERSHTRCLLSNDNVPQLCWSRINHCVEHISVLDKVHSLRYIWGAWCMPLSETFRESLVLLIGSAAIPKQTLSISQTIRMFFKIVEILFFIAYGKKCFVMKFIWEMIR
jgi:hypothetical protein